MSDGGGRGDAPAVGRLETGDGLPVAYHRFGHGGGRPTLIAHANGFHGRCYRALADELGPGYDCVAIDQRGHGLTGLRADDHERALSGGALDWRPLGVDVGALARLLAPSGGLVGVGHSMGGAALLMAAHRDPDVFDRLVLFEPVAPPPDANPGDPDQMPLVGLALRRRPEFESVEAAIGNYRAKQPMALMRSDVLRDYVVGGTRPLPHGVTLRCEPAVEAAFFRGSHDNGVWDLLDEIDVPTLVVSGRVEADAVTGWARGIADRLPNGVFRYEPDLTHFGPLSHPDRVADIVRSG